MCGLVLIIAGGALEAAGFGLLATDLYRQRSQEFGEPAFMNRLRRVLKRQGRVAVGKELSVVYGIGDARALGRARERAADESLEARLVALERNFEHMEHEIDADYERFKGALKQARYELDRSVERINQAIEEAEQARKESLRETLRLQVPATVLFVLGTLLSIVGGIAS